MKILLVEDEVTVGNTILSYLKQWEMEAVHAPSSQRALEVLADGPVDLMITDLAMPDMDGIDLIKTIRGEKRHKKLPVLMISGQANKDQILQASRIGVNGFVAKPFTGDQLKQKIYAAFRGRRQQLIDRQVAQLLKGREDLHGKPQGPLLVLGESIKSAQDLKNPANRLLVEYLSGALDAIEDSNDHDPELNLGYILENNTTSIVAHLKKPGTRKWVKLVLLSTRCDGNPILVVRLFSINRRDDIPIGMVYNHPDEIPPQLRKGFKKLGVRLVNRAKFDSTRFQALIDQYVLGRAPKKNKKTNGKPPSPKEIHGRILDDIESMTTLPTLPQVYEKILSLSRDAGSDLKQWIDVIKVDPMTCAAIFRHINSLNYGFEGEITDIDRAIILLGKRTVLGLVASEAVRQTFQDVEDQGFALEEFWLHNMAVGFAAQILSTPLDPEQAQPAQQQFLQALHLEQETVKTLERINLPRRLKLDYARENAFVGGVMHDIGKAVMVNAYPGLFPLLLAEMEQADWHMPMLEAERKIAGGLTHTTAGEILAQKWGLGDELCNVVLHHHQPEIDNSFAFLIALADLVGQSLYPFPRKGGRPLQEALENGDLKSVRSFLPEGFFEQPLLSPKEFVALAKAISPKVKHLTEEMRQMVQ